jgi:hypothetical protein
MKYAFEISDVRGDYLSDCDFPIRGHKEAVEVA